MRILLVEDNRQLSEWLARTLEADRYVVECSFDGRDANYRLQTQSYDLVILDLGLPGMDGHEVLQLQRARDNNVPILVLTASDSMASRISELDGGADDFMAKPFEVAELSARVRVLLRRDANRKNPLWHCGRLTFDSNTQVFTIAGDELALTPKEHALLTALMARPGKTVSKRALAESLYSADEDASPGAIEIYVHRLRKKLEGSGAGIVTLRGLGYRLLGPDV
jgi:two-component system response regulator TctD